MKVQISDSHFKLFLWHPSSHGQPRAPPRPDRVPGVPLGGLHFPCVADHRVIGLRHHETSAAPFPAKRVLVVGETMLPYRFSHWTGLLGVCGGRKIIASVSTKAFFLSPSGVFFFSPATFSSVPLLYVMLPLKSACDGATC